ncbi:flagellar assembly factor FliW [Terribacillus aidingensis]|uniref:Flagellar assembly factor FliW n=1 Tax=Terribacillus aidingensis TaxID=586416 RepID=A0A285N6P5_9BACI|nr:flagellar assembly protein FliW [Terribacillus aidingensis]SNZ05142.1 flagellar assembly factor FliW [Terribacillus aidingensis]
MNIKTKYFGGMSVDEKAVIRFDKGIPGFPEEKTFILIDFPENPLFQILQSTVTVHVAFIVASPYHFHQDYAFDLSEQTKAELVITKPEQVKILSILTLRNPFSNSTINLQAPLVINTDALKGQQIILSDGFSTRNPLQTEKARAE